MSVKTRHDEVNPKQISFKQLQILRKIPSTLIEKEHLWCWFLRLSIYFAWSPWIWRSSIPLSWKLEVLLPWWHRNCWRGRCLMPSLPWKTWKSIEWALEKLWASGWKQWRNICCQIVFEIIFSLNVGYKGYSFLSHLCIEFLNLFQFQGRK